MSKLTISINGRAFTIDCTEDQRAYLRDLADYIDNHVRDLANKVGQIGDVRLLLMASLIVADEMREFQNRSKTLEQQIVDLKTQISDIEGRQRADSAKTAEMINRAAENLESLAAFDLSNLEKNS